MNGEVQFSTKNWQEESYRIGEQGEKFSKVVATFQYGGVIEGEGSAEYLMFYRQDGATGYFVAQEQITGTVIGRKGSFAVQHEGTFDAHGVTTRWLILPDSATGDLVGLVGSAEIILAGHGPYAFTLEYDFE